MTAAVDATELLAGHGRLLADDERQTKLTWLVDGLIADSGVTAIAHADPRGRTAIGVHAVRALLGLDDQLLGCRVRQPAGGTVLVVAAPEHVALTYRTHFHSDRSVKVASMLPWNGTDADYWPAVANLAEQTKAAAVVIDTVHSLATGNVGMTHSRALECLDRPTLALYMGNGSDKPGIGGDGGWAFARRRFWIGGKGPLLHCLDSDDVPRLVTVPALPAVNGSLSAQQVCQLGELVGGNHVDRRGGPASIAGRLLSGECWPDVCAITGLDDPKVRDLTEAIGSHFSAWEAGLDGGSRRAPLPDDPPF